MLKNKKSYKKKLLSNFLIILTFLSIWFPIWAANRVIDLEVGYETVHFAGKSRQAIAVNNQIPGPTLHFKEGDQVTINVHNRLDKGTAIHWHGLILPWQMDGVEGITQNPIPPGGTFRYQFTLRQSGTYWYHAHAGLQEQQGLYGALVIDPIKKPNYQYTKDYVVVLSDWSNTHPTQILANLKKEGDYYSPRFPIQPSLMKFIHDFRKANSAERKLLMDDYKMMQQMRMSIYDLSDVAYDAFLLNGESNTSPWTAPVKVGDTVRLRFIGASGSTNYRVKIPGTKLQIVHIEGNDVKPYFVDNFTILPGETYDVLIKIQKDEPYIIYAESADTLGAAIGALIAHPGQTVDYHKVAPFPEPLPVTREMMDNMMSGMKMHDHMSMQHEMHMDMPMEPSIIGDKISSTVPASINNNETTGIKYQNLTAAVKTNNPNKPVQIIRMELFGYMDRYIWMINGLPEYKAKPIRIEEGKRYRIIFTNNSMMHHPMHIHGHWFILRNGHGAYDPLLHTIDVSPGSTAVADFDADASGQWFFHCHHLYHMMSGMARVFQYSTLIEIVNGEAKPQHQIMHTPYPNRPIVRVDESRPIVPSLVRHPMAHPHGFYFANFLDLSEGFFDNVQELTFKGLYGGDYNKLELFINDAEMNGGKVENADVDIFYWRLLNQFWAIKGGVNYFYRPANTPYWQPGVSIEGLMPYFIDTDLRVYYHSGSIKFDLELSRDTQITNNFFIRLEARGILATKTVDQDEVGSGLNQLRYAIRPYYRLAPALSLFVQFEYDQDYGAFKNQQAEVAEPTSETIFSFGISTLF